MGEVLSKGAKTYVLEKLAEKLGAPSDDYYSEDMEHGNILESEAAMAVANRLGVDPCSDEFIYTSSGGYVFYSTDSLGGTPDIIMPDYIVEIKCPKSHNWIRYSTIENNCIKKEWYWQMQANMLLSGKPLCLLAIYDDRLTGLHPDKWLKIIEVNENKTDQELLLQKVDHAWKLMNEIETSI